MKSKITGQFSKLIRSMLIMLLVLACTGSVLAQWDEEKEDKTIYNVVINHEEQYSIWQQIGKIHSAGMMRVKKVLKKSAWII